MTTRPIRELERVALTAARDAGRRQITPLARQAVDAAIAQAQASLGEGRALDPEQRDAVEAICAGTAWANLTGRAGTGKGPTIEAVAHAHRAAGWQVVATAVDETTAQRLAAQVRGPGYTIDSLVHRLGTGSLRQDRPTLVIVDEASKVDTARWAHIGRMTAADARVLAVGDTGQLDAIQLSGLFAEIVRRAPTIELDTIRRHRDPSDPSREHPWLGRYQAALHAGRGAEAVAILREQGTIRLHDSRAEAMVALVEDWNGWRHEHPLEQTMLLVHGTNGDVDTVNHLAQRIRRDAGELGDDKVAAPDRDYDLHAGDLAVVRGAPLHLPPDQGGGRIENGTTLKIAGVDTHRDLLAVEWDDPVAGRRTAELDLAPLRRHVPGVRRPAIASRTRSTPIPPRARPSNAPPSLVIRSPTARPSTSPTRAPYRPTPCTSPARTSASTGPTTTALLATPSASATRARERRASGTAASTGEDASGVG